MASQESTPATDRPGFAVLILCGALLGLAEIVVSSTMRNAGLPFRSGVLAGLGMGLMALALALYRRPVAIFGVAAVAALCKVLAIPVFQSPFFCNSNACIAVLLNGAALTALAAIAGRRMEQSAVLRVAAGMGAALAGVTAFYCLGVYVQPCRPLLNINVTSGFLAYLASKGLPAALAAGLLLPAGYALGLRLRESRLPALGRQGLVGYPAAAAILVSCWLLNGLLIG
jgi:hypothetical protein